MTDYNSVDQHETALSQFYMLWTKVEESPSEEAGRKQQEKNVLRIPPCICNSFLLLILIELIN